VLRELGNGARITQAELAMLTGLSGRTVRAILADIDGRLGLVLARDNDRLWIARTRDEADAYTLSLARTVATLAARIARRGETARRLPSIQGRLFDDEGPW
jgi:DNA-binding GntR family transcriptional regulator